MASARDVPISTDGPVCTYKEAMQVTGLKKSKLYTLFHKGVLRGYRDGNMIRFYRESLHTYMRQRENQPSVVPPSVPTSKPKRKSSTEIRFKYL
jgi:excisionase family DNA binding protein